MIAERRSVLLGNEEKWKPGGRLAPPPTDSPSSTHTPLKLRLQQLNKSADEWKRRVQKDDVSHLERASRRTSVASALENKLTPSCPPPAAVLPVSRAAQLTELNTGLGRFFSPMDSRGDECVDVDLDAVPRTEILATPRSRPMRPGRARSARPSTAQPRIAHIDVESVKLEEDPRDHIAPVVVEDDGAPVAKSARQGLAAVEDYSQAKGCLRQIDHTSPYPPVMLIRVKGEKRMDVRLVSPRKSAVVEEASYVLVTPKRLQLYLGSHSNILERTRATQLATSIAQRSDLHCSAGKADRVEGPAREALRDLSPVGSDVSPVEGEAFEVAAARSNLIVRVTDNYKLQTVAKGEPARMSMLGDRETLILDFGSEVYVWSGRNAKKTAGKYAMEYAQQMRQKAVPHSLCVLGEELGEGRAEWVHVQRVQQGVQQALFAAKFHDWKSSESRVVGMSNTPSVAYSPLAMLSTLQAATPDRSKIEADIIANDLRRSEWPEPSLVLEDQTLTREMKDVITEGKSMWVLRGEQLCPMEYSDVISSDSCYVLRWQYRVQKSGVRRLRTGEESEKETGRERAAYFYWLGADTTIKMHGTCALQLSYLNREKLPVVRLEQGAESPVFLALFQGRLVVDRPGSGTDGHRCWLVSGASLAEAHAVEVDAAAPLRSHAVYLRRVRGDMQVHTGCHVDSEVAVQAAIQLAIRMCTESSRWQLSSAAPASFVEGDLDGVSWTSAHGRVCGGRGWRVYEGEACALSSPLSHPSLAFPFRQSQLDHCVLLDVGGSAWLWSESAPSTLALRIVKSYWSGRSGECVCVRKGAEPEEFRALFPVWTEWTEEGGSSGDESGKENASPVKHRMAKESSPPPERLDSLLETRTQHFSPQQLRERTALPEGIDLTNLEQYLSDDDFQREFKTERSSFYALPAWKQIRIRKELGFF